MSDPAIYFKMLFWSDDITFILFQVRQEVAQEFEQVKDISSTLASFKTDNSRPSAYSQVSGYDEGRRHYEEPTRDPDVWPPPTPVEHK